MRRISRQLGLGEAPERESRLRTILLAATIVLVISYALTVTNVTAGGGILIHMAWFPLATVTAAAVTIAALGGLMVLARRRDLARNPPTAPEEPPPLAIMQGRAQLLETLSRLLGEHQVAGRQLSLHLVDFDRFSELNALLGEAEGDAFLGAIAERLLVLVDQTEWLGRIGDDEFAVIQPETGGARHAEIYAKRIEDTLNDACAQVPRHARPAPSIGVAVAPEHGETASRLLHNASLALRRAKRKSGGFRVFTRDLEMSIEARLQMERAISDGLLQGWFELRFQPQYDLQSRRLSGFEAIVRMKHPQRGELLQGEFLPAAEDSGLIQPLSEWFVREAMAAAAEWPPHLTLTVGISPALFLHGDAAATILGAAAQAGLDPARLVMGIPETAIFGPSESLADQLQRLKGRGAAILIDRFGADGSNLRSLSLLRCDAVRLDDTLMRQIGENAAVEDLLRGLIGTARSFGLAVMAEGVEGVAQAHFLMANGCHHVQGFLFGRPGPADEVAAIIAKDVRKATSMTQGPGAVRAFEAA